VGGTMTRWVASGGSFMSSSDRRIIFGLGPGREAGKLEILWPNQTRQTVENLKLDSYNTITEAGENGS
jgi:hypothetical protein